MIAVSKSTKLENQVRSYLKQRAVEQGVQIRADGSTIILSGVVASFYQRQICIACLNAIPDIDQLNDQLQVA